MVIGINQPASRIDRANWRIYSGLASGVGTLNGDGLPAVAYRCAVTVAAATGHADCAGSVTIGADTLDFLVSGQRKTTTILLSALPVPSATGLDCNILIEAITQGGANILHETTTTILCRFRHSQKEFVDSSGNWARSTAIADTTDTSFDAEDVFRFGGVDYEVKAVESFAGLDGTEIYRRLYLQ